MPIKNNFKAIIKSLFYYTSLGLHFSGSKLPLLNIRGILSFLKVKALIHPRFFLEHQFPVNILGFIQLAPCFLALIFATIWALLLSVFR